MLILLLWYDIIYAVPRSIVQLLGLWQIKDQYVGAMLELSQQNSQLQEESKRTKNELKVASIQVDDLKRVLEELRSEMLLKVTSLVWLLICYFDYAVCGKNIHCVSLWGVNSNGRLMAIFVRNIRSKNYLNLLICFQVTIDNVVVPSLRHGVLLVAMRH